MTTASFLLPAVPPGEVTMPAAGGPAQPDYRPARMAAYRRRRYRPRVTSRRLVLLRHAKADPAGRTDAERSLAPRGRADAAAVGRWLAAAGIVPDLAVVSPARRAGETWALAAAELGPVGDPVSDDRVYANTVEDLLAVVGEAPGEVGTLAVVGHNPSMGQLAFALDDGTGEDGARDALGRGYPTAAVSVFALADWPSAGPRAGRLLSFAVPRG